MIAEAVEAEEETEVVAWGAADSVAMTVAGDLVAEEVLGDLVALVAADMVAETLSIDQARGLRI